MVQECIDNCKAEGDPGCDAHCKGFASVPPPGTCPRFTPDEQLHCDLVPSSILAGTACSVASPTCPSGSTCGRVYDCAALDGNQQPIVCGSDADCGGLHCDSHHRYCIDPNKKSNCDDKDANGKCVGACFGRFACGQPEPGCAERATDTLTGRCSTTEICPDPGSVDTDTNPLTNPGSNLTPSPFPADDLFPEDPPTPEPTPYPLAGPDTCGGPGQAACDFPIGAHPWCNYKVDPAETPSCGQSTTTPGAPCKSVSDADPAFGDKKGASGHDSGPIRFDFDPNLDISYEFGNPLPLGDTQFGAHAIASATADAHFNLFGIGGDVSILDARGQVDVDRCGFNNDVKVDLFGIDLLPLVVDGDNLDKLRSANTSAEDRQTCQDTLGEIQKLVNRAQKALRDAQELIRQEKELVANGQRFSPDLCHQLLEASGKGLPADFPSASAQFQGCGALSPEDTINLFSRYYKQQVIALKAQVGALLDKSAAKVPSINVGFLDQQAGQVEDENRREVQQIANFNFAIGPIPMNLTIEAFVQYGVAGNLGFSLSPKAIANTLLDNTNEPLAEVDAAFTPFAGAGVSMFLGVGFDFGPLSAKLGISGDVSLGVVSLPLYASAGIKVQAANDDRPLPADLQAMAASGNMLYPQGPPRKFRFNAHYNFGIGADIKDILKGTIYGKLRIKFFWFSKTWQKKIAEFPSLFPEFKQTLIGGEGDAPFAFGDLGLLGFIHMPVTFIDFAPLDTPPSLPPLDTGSGGSGGGGTGGSGGGSAGASGHGGARVSLFVQGDPRYKDFDPSRVDQLFYAGYCECTSDGAACTSNLDCCGTSTCLQNDDLHTKTCDQCAHTSTFAHQGQRCQTSADCCGPTDHCEPYGNVPPDASPRYCQVCVAEDHAMKTHNVSNVPDFPDECCPGLTPFNPPAFVNGVMTPFAGPPICHSCQGDTEACNVQTDCCGAPDATCFNNVCVTVK